MFQNAPGFPLSTTRALVIYGLLAALLAAGAPQIARQVFAQAAGEAAGPAGGGSNAAADAAPASVTPRGINLLELTISGGVFMIPIGIMSMIVATFTVERFLGLRKTKVLPEGLIAGLGQLGGSKTGFDPRAAYKLCQKYPSAASTVIRSMLPKVGRPHSEVEHAVAEASEREAERLYSPVRWLNLATSVAPLLGLLGTVWGLIVAFHDTTQLGANQNKAEFLAKGIYIALVTTLGGLSVAIPSAILAHYFEGRIQTLFHQIDELLFNLLPQIERYEGRVRFGRPSAEQEAVNHEPSATPPAERSAAASN